MSITPLLKKKDFDSDVAANYRPISNLHSISKMLERLFMARIRPHVESCHNFNEYQSAYRRGHSTETTLLRMLDDVYRAADNHSRSLLLQLDLSAAFDTLDNRLSFAGWTTPLAYVAHSRSGSTPTSMNAVSMSELVTASRHLSAATTECLKAACLVPCCLPSTPRQLLTSSHPSETSIMHNTLTVGWLVGV